MIYHIDIDRYERLRAQGYQFAAPKNKAIAYVDGDSIFHLIRGERDYCGDCCAEVESLKSETPADLDTEKHNLN